MEPLGPKFGNLAAYILSIGFVLNVIWEFVQLPFYRIPENGFWGHVSMCLAAAVADILIISILYFFIALIVKDIYWVRQMSQFKTIVSVGLGIGIAIVIERLAITVGWWEYNAAMPLVPYVNVGLVPVLQMATIPLITFYVSHVSLKNYYARSQAL